MEKIIEVNHLRKCFKDKTAVDDLSFYVNKGECFGLLGHNGAGKSTTIDCILGLKNMNNGTSKILGMNPRKDRKQLFENVGVQLQNSNYQDKIKVYELCEEIACLYKEPLDYHILLEKFGLENSLKQYVSTLSGGEKQRLSVLLALIPNPKVLFLDELTTGLDTVARHEIWKILLRLKEDGVTLLITSHYMDEVEALCDRICLIKNGKEVISGTVHDVIEASGCKNMEDAYLFYMDEGGLMNEKIVNLR